MMEIIENITIGDVRKAKPTMIYYGANTCWWTHDPTHLNTLPVSDAELTSMAEILRLNSSTPNAPLSEFIDRARKASSGLPCDPRGGVLFQTDSIEGFLQSAEQNPGHYGKHGLRAFMAAHHSNCFIWVGYALKNWASPNWQEYNDAIDQLDQRKELAKSSK